MNFYLLILFMFIYGFIGYIYESTINLINKVPIKSRGFLYGPIRPIYSLGSITIILIFYNLHLDTLPLFFLSGLFACSLEYLSSVILEKLFNKKYWDYSNNLFNLNGRVCLLGFTVFGICSVFLVNIFHPILLDIIYKNMTDRSIVYTVFILSIVFITDLIISLYNLYHQNKKRLHKL